MKPTQQTIDKFRKTILDNTSEEHKAEILELKFGCEIKIGNNPFALIFTIFDTDFRRDDVQQDDVVEYLIGSDYWIDKSEITEIIGRDLTLEDVLMAIKNKYENNIGFFVNQYGIFYEMKDEKEFHNPESKYPIVLKYYNLGWFLTKPAHLQSEETLLAIIKLFE